jgi:hypothetical protein
LRRENLLTSQGIPEGRGRKTSEGERSGIFSGSTHDERSPPAAKNFHAAEMVNVFLVCVIQDSFSFVLNAAQISKKIFSSLGNI